MTKKIIWRLKEQPSTESLQGLVKEGILTKDEAREILFSQEEQTERDTQSLKEEVKFLRELVEKLSQNRNQIVEIIREVEKPGYKRWPWYEPYMVWCGSAGTITTGNAYTSNTTTAGENTFTDISTF